MILRFDCATLIGEERAKYYLNEVQPAAMFEKNGLKLPAELIPFRLLNPTDLSR